MDNQRRSQDDRSRAAAIASATAVVALAGAGCGADDRAGGGAAAKTSNLAIAIDRTIAVTSTTVAAQFKEAARRFADPVFELGGHLRVAAFAGAGVIPRGRRRPGRPYGRAADRAPPQAVPDRRPREGAVARVDRVEDRRIAVIGIASTVGHAAIPPPDALTPAGRERELHRRASHVRQREIAERRAAEQRLGEALARDHRRVAEVREAEQIGALLLRARVRG